MKPAYLVLFLSLGACGSSPTGPTVITPPALSSSPVSNSGLDKVKERVDADPNLLIPCGSFVSIPRGSNPDTLLEAHKVDAVVWGDCARRTDALIQILKEAFNLK